MIKPFFLLFWFLISFFSFSQSKTVLKGKIVSDNLSLSNAEIVNIRTKKVVVSDEFGDFTIAVNINDLLVIIAKEYFEKKIYITSNLLSQEKLSISVNKKATELKEVIVKKEQLVSPTEIAESGRINSYNTTMRANQTGVYTGETINGIDFIAVGKLIGKLFKKKKPIITVNFKEYITDNITKFFLFETLKLDEKDYFRFLDFCEADTDASKLVQEGNEFKIVNFLFEKKEAFDRL
jgi:hypothetical protein